MSFIAARVSTLLLGAVIAAGVLSGCEFLEWEAFSESATVPVAITEVRVQGGSGDVTVRPGDPARAALDRTVEYRGDRPDVPQHRVEGTVLYLATSCGRNCSVNYTVTAPPGVRVSGENGSGDLRLFTVSTVDFSLGSGDVVIRDPSGTVNVRTRSGDIEVINAGAETTVRATSGDVQALDFRGPTLTVKTSSGDALVQLFRPANVNVEANSGDVQVAVPAGSYKVDATTGSGDRQIRITPDPAGTHTLTLRTGSGDVTLKPR